MIRSKFGLKALGLCVLAVGIMAISFASVAHAEESGGSWTFMNGAKLETLPNNQTIGGEIESGTDGTLLTKIGGNAVEFLCTSFTVNEGLLITGGTAAGKLTFHGCTTKINGTTQAKCEPNAGGVHKGLIETLALKGTLLLHKLTSGTKDKILIVEPATGSNAFAHIELGELCSLGENVLVGGPSATTNSKFAIVDCKGEGEKHLEKHLITEFAPLTHLWVISDTVEHKATIDGSALAFLTGATNGGKAWAALWN
jgi:hypothetical protein